MSNNRNLARLPAATMSGVLSTIAAGLRGDTKDVFQLRVDEVCLRTLSMIRTSNPMLEKSIAIGLPIALLGIGIWQQVTIIMKLTSGAQQIYASCLCHLTVHGSHHLNKLVCSYLSKQGIGQDTRSLAIAPHDPHDADSENVDPDLKYLPAPTTDAWFKFDGSWIKFTRAPQQQPQSNGYQTLAAPKPDVTLSCFSLTGNVKPIKDFLGFLQATSTEGKNTLKIIRGTPSQQGRSSIHRPARKLSSVSMEAALKDRMIADMAKYLASEDWYAARGIPWRRGYLFYGPPGTGKTSISTAIAGHFNIPLVIIGLALPDMDDAFLQETFDHLPRRCVVLLEDLDSAGIGRENAAKPKKQVEVPDTEADMFARMVRGGRRKPNSAGITLSGLLNAIDGPASHEGRILVCTTNSPDSLDAALLRPGRIDMKILFGNATAEVTESLFAHIFEDSTGKLSELEVSQMAKRFATLIPENQLTPAEIQNFLLQHRDDPSSVLDGAEAWVEEVLAVKNQHGNVASFKGQI